MARQLRGPRALTSTGIAIALTVAVWLGGVSGAAAAAPPSALPDGASISGTVRGAIAEGAGLVRVYRDSGAGQWIDVASAELPLDGKYVVGGLPAGDYRVFFVPYETAGDATGWGEWWDDSATAATARTVTLADGQQRTGIDADVRLLKGKKVTASILGKLAAGETLRADPGFWPIGTRLAYAWYAGRAYLGDAPTVRLPASAAGARVRLYVYGSEGTTSPRARYSGESAVVAAGHLASSVPAVSGTPAVGSTLRAAPGRWTSGTTFAYQWYADGAAIRAATSSSLTLRAAQKAKSISVTVTGTKAGYAALTQTSKATPRVATVGTATISGTSKVGATLTAGAAKWLPGTRFSYQWYAAGSAVRGATASTWTVTRSHRGQAITVAVTGRKSGYATVTATSKAATKPLTVGRSAVGGRVIATVTLTAKTTGWTRGTTFAYRWYADGSAIAGATKKTLKLTSRHIGARITVKATGTRPGYAKASTTSRQTAAVRPGKARPASKTTCPRDYPIKGNQTTRHTTDWIYHVPGGQYYRVTHPEECFATEEAAEQSGYRASMR